MDLGFASAPAVLQYVRYARSQGLDIDAVLSDLSLDYAQLCEPQARLSGNQFQALLKRLIDLADDPLLGLKSGQFVEPGSYSVLGYITMNCATLSEALAYIVPYEKLVGDMGISELLPVQDGIALYWQCRYPEPVVRAHMIANVLMSWCHYARWLAHSDMGPATVLLEYDLNPSEQTAFEQAFNAKVLTKQARSGLIITQQQLALPLRQPDPQLRQTLEQHALHQLKTLDSDVSLSHQVSAIIRNQLREGLTRKDLVAEQLDINARTLQRRLAAQGTSYQELLDQIRLDLAKDYLHKTTLQIHEIANQLGFSEPRSFHRSFKSWTGQTPGEFRESDSMSSKKNTLGPNDSSL